jgi:hypothetical protein
MRKKCLLLIGPWLLLICLVMPVGATHAAEVMLVGEINDTAQLVADNQIYEIGPGELGDYLVTRLISAKVKVYGDLVEENHTKIIHVKRYEVVLDE